ncbi:tetratricopeptide repeat protein [Halomicronema sp. CCY15110]|uniref:tetratricopeptide repeat protein n=1 Tax=Halomicronema sp. CCY15110 TaxID=2767773 RepID=UPI001951F380|nr:tetratricopeptide repeat protein [Halomicronema sp. CCY15110]
MPPTDLETSNRRELRKLELSIEAQPERLSLLLAICDDRNLQAQLMEQYEAELREAGIATYRTRLSHQRPSLKAALTELVEQSPALQAGDPAVVTVLNAGELLGVRLTEEKSEQEQFFFSLQWTREALRHFDFPIVLWLPDEVATRLAQQAPDFWSWRNGVFEFYAAPPDAVTRPDGMPPPMMSAVTDSTETAPDPGSQIPITELEQQIATLTETTPDSPLLITLHNTLGDAYKREYKYQKALAQYQQALTQAEAYQDAAGQARSLRNLGDALRACGRPAQAVPYYQQALNLYQAQADRSGDAATLNNLGVAYFSLSQYQQAITFYHQSLEIQREIGDRQGEAKSLSDLGNAYNALGQYQQAIAFHQQSLEMAREIGDRRGEAAALGNLGLAYQSLGQYQQAIAFHQQSLEIKREIGVREAFPKESRRGEATSLGNLGLAYRSLGQYQQAIAFLQQQLEITREIGDRQGEANALGNLGLAYYDLGQYQQAITFQQQSLEIEREIGDRRGEANSLFNQALALARLDDKWQARDCYQAAREIYAELGLPKEVERCDVAIRDLGQQIVMQPKQAPTIGESATAPSAGRDHLSPTAESRPTVEPQPLKVPFWVWVVVGLVGVLLIGWWLL